MSKVGGLTINTSAITVGKWVICSTMAMREGRVNDCKIRQIRSLKKLYF